MARHINPWFSIGLHLGFEPATVIALRSLALAQGGAKAQAEAVRTCGKSAGGR